MLGMREESNATHSSSSAHAMGRPYLQETPSALPGTKLLEPATLGMASPRMEQQDQLCSLPKDSCPLKGR